MRTRRLPGILALVALAGCAARGPGPADIPTLEARLRADSSSTDARVQLAAAFASAGEAARAIPLLEPVVRADSSNAAAALYLGLGYEAADRNAEARRLYERFIDEPVPASLRERISERLDLVARRELRDAVRASLAREAALANVDPEARTVGVFPFLTAGDTLLRPLGRALAELLTTDLGQTTRLRVVERARVQMLLDEMALGSSRYADPATAARTGHIVGAASLVQGRVEGSEADLAMQAVVVATTRPDTTAEALREQGPINDLFDMEKQIAFSVYDRLGIQLTAAERERVNRRQTENVQALLAFGYGLEARDAGRFRAAADYFRRASELDPGFELATDQLSLSIRLDIASTITTLQIAQQAATELDFGMSPFQREMLGFDVLERMIPTPLVRDPSVEVVGAEGVGRGTVIDIVIRRPGGLQ